MDKTNGVEKMAHAQAEADAEVQMQSPPIKNRKKIWRRLRPLVKHQFGIEKYTPEVVDFFVNLLRESSALCIQAAWKGYVARKQYPALREQLRREKAAVTIQRFVRECLYKKKIDELFKKKKKDSKEENFEFTLEEMDEKIMDWRKKHNIYSVAIPEDDDELDRELERQMKQFYKNVEMSKERTQYVDKLLCEIDYQLSTLTDITSLFEKDESEAAKYNEGRREAYTRALSSVQQNLRYMNAPWFRRIDYELSGDYNDVYFPSEIDACVQLSKEQEEARKPDYNDVYFPSEIDACVQLSKEQEEARKPDYNDVYFPSEIDACVQLSKEQEEARKPDSEEEIKL